MIEVYKIFSGKYDATVTKWLTDRHLESHYDLRDQIFIINLRYIIILGNTILQTG